MLKMDDILEFFKKAGLGTEEYFYQELVEDEFWDSLQIVSNNYFSGFRIGASKAVFIPKEGNYVIKIPFNASLNEDYNEKYDDEPKFFRFDYAGGLLNDWDYCAVESERYFLAQDYGFEKYFMPTTYVGSVNNYPVYIQALCITMNNANNSSKQSKDRVNEIKCNKYYRIRINVDWAGYILEHKGEEELIRLFDFLNKEGWNDFHQCNVGFYNGEPVIFDYSDFNE